MGVESHAAREFENDGVVAHGGDEMFDEPSGEGPFLWRRQEDVDAAEVEAWRVFNGSELESIAAQ